MRRLIIHGPKDPECLDLGVAFYQPYLRFDPPKIPFFYGPIIDLTNIFAEKLGFCYRTVYPFNTVFGNKLPNGTWTGLIGMVIRKELDFAIPPFAYSLERWRAVEYSNILDIDSHSVTYKYPTFTSDVFGFIKPFTSSVWGCIAALLLVMTAVMGSIALFKTYVLHQRTDGTPASAEDEEKRDADKPNHIMGAAMLVYRALVGQSLDVVVPVHQALLGLWLVMCLVIGTIYKGNLMSKLIAPKVNIPFSTFEELMANAIPYRTTPQTYFIEVAKLADEGSLLRRLYEGLDGYTIDVDQLRQQMIRGDYAFIMFRRALLGGMHHMFNAFGGNCVTTMIDEHILPAPLSMVFPKKSPWKKKIDPMIIALREFGIIQKMLEDATLNATHCLNPQNQAREGTNPLKMKDFYGIFSMYLGGMFLAAMAFVGEVCKRGCRRRKRNPEVQQDDIMVVSQYEQK
uniref:Glutamate receptor ionotropic, kainate 2-like n=1 Tax=Hirondellea gigas TaxID=1518452 RepID=A0A2P2IBZ3_9CRUS